MDTAVIASVVNFSVVIGVLVYAGRKPLATFLQSRSEAICGLIDEAERLSRESLASHGRWSSLLAASPGEVSKLRRDAELRVEKLKQESLENSRKETDRIERESGMVSKTEYSRAKRCLEKEVVIASVEMARTYLERNLEGGTAVNLFHETLERVRDGA